MPGVQTFPTPLEGHSITEVSDLLKKYSSYGIKVGFADHVAGDTAEAIQLPLMAFAAGACLVEKHITVNRKNKWIDYESSLDFKKFQLLTIQSKKLCKLLLRKEKYTKYDYLYRKQFKKSAFT